MANNAAALAAAQPLLEMQAQMVGLAPVLPHLRPVPRDRLTVTGEFPKQCYSYARLRSSKPGADGYYCEGVVVPAPLPLPVGHAWYEAADGAVVDGTDTPASMPRFGVRVPAAAFRAAMASPAFAHTFETHDLLPFHRAAKEHGVPTPWLNDAAARPKGAPANAGTGTGTGTASQPAKAPEQPASRKRKRGGARRRATSRRRR
jgi:hypothetical protein